MLASLQAFTFFLKSLFAGSAEFSAIRQTLLRAQVFDFPERDRNNRWLNASVLFFEIRELFSQAQTSLMDHSTRDRVGAIVSNDLELQTKADYVHSNTKEGLKLVVPKESIWIPSSLLGKVFSLLYLSAFHSLIWLYGIFSRLDHRNLALLPRVSLRLIHLQRAIRNAQIRKVYLFYPYQLDTNLIERFLDRYTEVIIVPLPNPLSLYCDHLTARKFVATLPFQKEEIQKLYGVDLVHEDLWVTESLVDKQRPKDLKFEPNTIAIYSHGSLARLRKGHPIPEIGDLRSEINFFNAMASIVQQGKFRFVLHLHPKEKSDPRTLEWSMQNYRELLGDQVEFQDPATSTLEAMWNYELAIGSISSVLFERQSAGLKTLIYAEKITGFPLPGTQISKPVVTDSTQLSQKIIHWMEMRQVEYDQEFASLSLR